MKRTGRHFVYIVECRNRTYYTGYTVDLDHRLQMHNSGKGAKYLRGKGPVKLVWFKEYKYYKWAVRRECAIKQLRRCEKEALIVKG